MTQPLDGLHVLLVDDAYVHSTQGLKRTLHKLKPHAGNPLIVQDKDWECDKGTPFYPGVVLWANPVIWDVERRKFRMWYTGFWSVDPQGRDTSLLMYAESDDGLRWEKPNLGRVEWNGSKNNNIVMLGVAGIGKLRLLETPNIIYRPDEPDSRDRFRLIAYMYQSEASSGHWLFRSADGLTWEELGKSVDENSAIIKNAREFNGFFWDARQRKYIGTVRLKGIAPITPRHVGYTESHDFLDWRNAELAISPQDLNTRYNRPGDDVYGLCSFRYESHILGFLHAHHADRRVEVQLMSSLDGRQWGFVGEGDYILPNDPPGGYGCGMMSTQSGPPMRVGNELRIYIGLSPKSHRNGPVGPEQQARAIGLATLRVDGFASLDAGDVEAELVTQPLRFGVGRLRVNARPTSTGGALRAEILDADGTPLPGYAANECQAVAEDAIDGTIRWTETDKVPATSADGARIRFVMKNVQIFSFWIEEEDNFNMDRNRL